MEIQNKRTLCYYRIILCCMLSLGCLVYTSSNERDLSAVLDNVLIKELTKDNAKIKEEPEKAALIKELSEKHRVIEEEVVSKELTEYEQRIAHFKDMCSILENNFTSYSEALPIIYAPDQNFSFCMLSKTGSSTWAIKLLRALPDKHIKDSNPHLKILASYPLPNKNMSLLKDVYSVLFVRHPFIKFASAFRMNIYLIADEMKRKKIPFQGSLPSMAEYVPVLLQHKRYEMDIHFFPFWYRCRPCDLHLDFIGKMETFKADHDFLFEKLSLPMLVKQNKYNARKGMSSTEYASMGFKAMSKEQVLQLYKFYEYDFKLFNYSIEPYYSLAK